MSNEKNKSKKIPDYRINSIIGILNGPSLEYRSFNMYINESIDTDGTNRLIEGTIEDKFGIGNFKGEISDTEFTFIIKYTEDAIRNGAPKGDTKYRGFKIKDSYSGGFKLVDNENEEIPLKGNNRFGAKKYNIKTLGDDLPPSEKKNYGLMHN
jgi:hypothetical protein